MPRCIERPVIISLTTIWVVCIIGFPLAVFPPDRAITASAESENAKPSSSTDESWQVIYTNGQRIGYTHSTARTEQRDGRDILVTQYEEHLNIKRFGQSLQIEQRLLTEETEEGKLLSYVSEIKNPPAMTSRSVGIVQGRHLEIESTVAGRKQTRTMTWDTDVKSPTYQDRWIEQHGLKPGDRFSFKMFMPELDTVATVKIQADDYRSVKLHDGHSRRLLKTRITMSMPSLAMMQPITSRAYLDEEGVALRTETEMLGTQMVNYTVSEDVALEELAGGELDLAVSTLVHVKQLRNPHRSRKAVYRIKIHGADPTEFLPTGSTQQVKRIDAHTAELTVTAAPRPQSARHVPADPEYLEPSQYLQSRDRRVVEYARRAAAGDVDPLRIALRMERYVHDRLIKKNFSTAMASAAEVAESLEGDCTEHAVLLAAMLRAKRIPSRLAAGMVYNQSESAFCGHMWTEAFLGGQWYPLDATLGLGGIGAAHIKLAESSFSDEGPSPLCTFLPLINVGGKTEIDVVEFE